MEMPGRDTLFKNGYRYGFNGKEIDNEPYGQGNEYDYGFRIYNPRIGRFLSVDPLTQKYPELTPYQFASNTPIQAIDLDGLEAAGVGFGISPDNMNPQNSQVTGKAMIGVAKGFTIAAKNTIVGLWNIVTSPKQAAQSAWHAVSNPIKTWQGIKSGANQWGSNLMSTNPDVAGQAVGSGLELGTEILVPIPPIMKGLKIPYMSGKFIIGAKTLAKVTEHLEQFGVRAENTIMLERMQQIANKELKATEIDINFAKHELREAELMKAGKTYEEAHEAVLKEQNMYHAGYEKKLYTEDALKAGNEQMEKEVTKPKK